LHCISLAASIFSGDGYLPTRANPDHHQLSNRRCQHAAIWIQRIDTNSASHYNPPANRRQRRRTQQQEGTAASPNSPLLVNYLYATLNPTQPANLHQIPTLGTHLNANPLPAGRHTLPLAAHFILLERSNEISSSAAIDCRLPPRQKRRDVTRFE
jgi:hypothetical protein